MKKATSIILVCSVLAGLACLSGCTGGMVGGFRDIIVKTVKNNIPDNRSYNTGNGTVGDKIDNISVSWTSGSVELKTHSKDTVEITETASAVLAEAHKVHWYVENGTLNILYMEPGIHTAPHCEKHLTVTVPETVLDKLTIGVSSAAVRGVMNAKALSIATSSGNVDADVNADELAVATSSGKIALRTGSDADSVALSTASGVIDATLGRVMELAVSTASGAVRVDAEAVKTADISGASARQELAFATVPGKLDVDSASGAVTLALPADAGITLKIVTASGAVGSDLPFKLQGKSCVLGDGKAEGKINTASGNVRITEYKG